MAIKTAEMVKTSNKKGEGNGVDLVTLGKVWVWSWLLVLSSWLNVLVIFLLSITVVYCFCTSPT